MRTIAVTVARLLLPILVAGCSAQAAAKPSASPSPTAVGTTTATRGTITPTLQIAGVIAPYRQIGVGADLTEPIDEVDVQEGDHVRAGQVLARLLTDDLEAQLASAQREASEDVDRSIQTAYQVQAVNAQDQSAVGSAEASLRQAEVNLSGALVDLKRYVFLAQQGYLAAQTVDEQRTTVATDQAAVASARASLNQAVANAAANGVGTGAGEQQQELAAARAAADAAKASVVQLQREMARAVIVSPVDGVVESVNANPGEYPSGRELFTIEQNASVYAVLPTSTAQVVQIRPGAGATVVPNGTATKDRGTVTAVLDEVEPGTTNFTVKVLLANPNDTLRAGMPVTGTIALPSVSGVEIPVTAFVDDTHASVYTVDDGVVHSRQVSEVKDDGNNAIVTGLPAGSVIVKDVEQTTVGNGDRVASTN